MKEKRNIILPGGKEDIDRDKYIPHMMKCHYYEPLRMLIICFVDRKIRFFHLKNIND
jgi:hypothetical protein